MRKESLSLLSLEPAKAGRGAAREGRRTRRDQNNRSQGAGGWRAPGGRLDGHSQLTPDGSGWVRAGFVTWKVTGDFTDSNFKRQEHKN